MTYAKKFINSRGVDCKIHRHPLFNTKVSIKRSTNSVYNVGVRDAFFQGLIPSDSDLLSGEIIVIESDKYIVQTVRNDLASRELEFYCAKCNVIARHRRITEKGVDNYNNIIRVWKTLKRYVHAYGDVVTYRMIQQDPGLLEGTKYTLQVPKSLRVKLLDRFEFNNEKYQVISIDNIGLDGVCRCQLQADLRP